MVKFARKYPVGHRLMIDMGLITDKDGLFQKACDSQFRHYYPCPLQLHSEKSPEPLLPAFTMLKDKKKKKRQTSEAAEQEAKHVSEEKQADDDQVKGALIDPLESLLIHPSKAASSGVNLVSMDGQGYARSAQLFKVSQQHCLMLGDAHWSPLSHQAYSLQDLQTLVLDSESE
ncbi:hypothetical protein ARMGADRAFT_1036734 [Armillaria gallica]|uniref:Uncharacterized protein n=1 Tax=Armillaria gallica TaxID=47427 RepID=A0A2H3CT43_ARMGA|nr:hypothetical protein ARMGADRAFT_1036734 [Armillaria gallica]